MNDDAFTYDDQYFDALLARAPSVTDKAAASTRVEHANLWPLAGWLLLSGSIMFLAGLGSAVLVAYVGTKLDDYRNGGATITTHIPVDCPDGWKCEVIEGDWSQRASPLFDLNPMLPRPLERPKFEPVPPLEDAPVDPGKFTSL